MKLTLITGPRTSGKSFLANNISEIFESPLYIDCRGHSKLPDLERTSISVRTDLIICDEVSSLELLKELDLLNRSISISVQQMAKTSILVDTPTLITIINTEFLSYKEVVNFGQLHNSNIIQCDFTNGIFSFSKEMYL